MKNKTALVTGATSGMAWDDSDDVKAFRRLSTKMMAPIKTSSSSPKRNIGTKLLLSPSSAAVASSPVVTGAASISAQPTPLTTAADAFKRACSAGSVEREARSHVASTPAHPPKASCTFCVLPSKEYVSATALT